MVERLLSTDPNDYLDPHLQPGASPALLAQLRAGPVRPERSGGHSLKG